MTDFLTALRSNIFLQMAMLAGCIASIASGIVGSYVVVKRITFLSGSIAHSVLGGMGIFLFLRRLTGFAVFSPIYGALIAAIIAAWIMGYIHLRHKEREDTVIAALWAAGMSIGVIFTSLTPGYNVEIINFLFGNILWASSADIYYLLGLDAIILIITLLFHRKFLAISFDNKQAWLQKLPVNGLYFLLLSLVAITVVLLIQVIGAILVIAMLSLPPAIAGTFTGKLPKMMGLAALLGIAFTFCGILLSFMLNWPPGATISLTASFFFLINLLRIKK